MTQGTSVRWTSHAVPVIGLLLLTLAVYGQVVGYDFIINWDDNLYVTSNPDILGFTTNNLIRLFSSSYAGNYAPIHLLSYMLDYQLSGMNSGWFHGVNVVFHIANGLLFYLAVFRLTGKPFWGFVSSAVFLLHPVQVESVAWVTERKNLLAMFFSLGAFICYISYRQETGTGRKCAYLFSLILLALALLAKSIAVIMPGVFLLHDFFLETPRRDKGIIADKIPFIVAAAIAASITMITQSAEMGGGIVDYFAGNLGHKSLTMLSVLTRYLHILVWPSNLNIIYIFFIKTRVDREAILSLILVMALTSAGIYLWRRDRQLCFGYTLFFLGLVPVSQIAPLSTLMNDRYLYFPMLGAAWMLGGWLSRLNDRFTGRGNPAQILCVCLLFPCALLAHHRTSVWQDSITLWSDAAAKLPTLKDPRASLAEAYLDAGQNEKALATYGEVFSLKREFSDLGVEQKALNNAANLYLKKGLLITALPILNTLTTKFPDYPPGFLNLGYYHYLSRNLPEAEKAYHKAFSLDPRSAQACIWLGNICLETGRIAEARSWYRTCYENGGNTPDLQYDLACLEALAQNQEKSMRHLEEALRLGYRNLAAITGNPELATIRRLPSLDRLLASYFPDRK